MKDFQEGQIETLRTLYSLYRRRPDFRLQSLEVVGMSLKISPEGRALKLESQISEKELETIPENEQREIHQMAEFYRWRRSTGTSQQFARQSKSVIHLIPEAKKFGLPDDYFEIGVSDGFTSAKVPGSIRRKYPELFINRNRFLGETSFEQSWHVAYQNLMQYLKVILQTPAAEQKIKIDQEQRAILQKVYQNRQHISAFKFVSGKAQPKLFESDNLSHRLAITGDKLGSEIWINSDQAKGPIDIASLTGLMLHELGHHAGYKDGVGRPLDKVAALLTDFIRQTSAVKKFNGPTGDVEIIILRPQMMTQQKLNETISPIDMWGSRLLINDGKKIWDMTSELFSAMADNSYGPVSFFSIKDFNIDIKAINGNSYSDRKGYTFSLPVQLILKNNQTKTLEPMTLDSQVSFWLGTEKERAGILVWPTLQASVYPKRMLPNEYVVKSPLSYKPKPVPATILSSAVSQNIKAGDKIEVTAIVKIPLGAEVNSAWIDLSSPQMMNMIEAMPTQAIQLSAGTGIINIVKISKDQVQIKAEFHSSDYTNSKQLILESVNLIYRDGNYSYSKPPIEQIINIRSHKENKGISVANLKLGNGKFIMPPGFNFNHYEGKPAEISLELSGVTALSHMILIGDVQRIDNKGIEIREGFSVNLSAGDSPIVNNIKSDARFNNTIVSAVPMNNMTLGFSVSTQREFWGADAKMIHLKGIYVRDFNLEERFIQFGANFAFFIDQ